MLPFHVERIQSQLVLVGGVGAGFYGILLYALLAGLNAGLNRSNLLLCEGMLCANGFAFFHAGRDCIAISY